MITCVSRMSEGDGYHVGFFRQYIHPVVKKSMERKRNFHTNYVVGRSQREMLIQEQIRD